MLADYVMDHVVSSPEGAILVTSPGTKSPYPRPPQSRVICDDMLREYAHDVGY